MAKILHLRSWMLRIGLQKHRQGGARLSKGNQVYGAVLRKHRSRSGASEASAQSSQIQLDAAGQPVSRRAWLDRRARLMRESR
jgi:hypothetical protein